jgi:hypothetical protein
MVFMIGLFRGLQVKVRGQTVVFSSLNISHSWTVNEKLNGFLGINMNQCISDQRE